MSDNTSDSTEGGAMRRSSHISTGEAEFVPPPVPPRPPRPGDSAETEITAADTDVEAGEPGADGDPAEAEGDATGITLASTPRKRMSATGVGIVIAALLAIAGWVAFGVALAQLIQANEQLAALEDQLRELDGQLDVVENTLADTKIDVTELTVERDRLKKEAESMGDRESAVAAKETELQTREAAVKAAEEYVAATTLKDGYTYTVGLTMQAGVYRANSASDRCYWAVYRSGSNQSDIVGNDLGAMGAITLTVTEGQDFESRRCGDWAKVG